MAQKDFSDGTAGASAQFEYQKRLDSVENRRIAQFGPKLGKLVNLYSGDSKSVEAWRKGSIGEIHIGEVLDNICEKHGFSVLHDRKIPKSVANIDHILITDRGIFVIDAKNYKGIVRIEKQGGLFGPSIETLFVGNRKQGNLVLSSKKQVSLVSKVMQGYEKQVPIFGLLAFYNAEWPLFFKPKSIDGILINSKGIEVAVLEKDPIELMDLTKIFKFLQGAFPAK